jgi:hypothetical protein
MTDDLGDAIETAAASPRSVTSDGVTVEQQSLRDLIDADKHLASKTARTNPVAALIRLKIVSPGSE